jgi:hypothetical protein
LFDDQDRRKFLEILSHRKEKYSYLKIIALKNNPLK